MIIAINGKIGAGKDTVGKIIQLFTYLNNECDWRESEKKEALEDLHKGNIDSLIHDIGIGRGYGDWKVKKFAGKLKEIASILTGIPIEKFEDQEFKKTFLGEEWALINQNTGISIPNNFGGLEEQFVDVKMTVRDLLQKLGTEALRNGLHENTWCNALFADYKLEDDSNLLVDNGESILDLREYSNWLITDLRFPNEFQAVKDRNGICVRVSRDYVLRGAEEDPKKLHPSETALDNHIFDYEIQNDGSIEDLVEEVRKMLINFKII